MTQDKSWFLRNLLKIKLLYKMSASEVRKINLSSLFSYTTGVFFLFSWSPWFNNRYSYWKTRQKYRARKPLFAVQSFCFSSVSLCTPLCPFLSGFWFSCWLIPVSSLCPYRVPLLIAWKETVHMPRNRSLPQKPFCAFSLLWAGLALFHLSFPSQQFVFPFDTWFGEGKGSERYSCPWLPDISKTLSPPPIFPFAHLSTYSQSMRST